MCGRGKKHPQLREGLQVKLGVAYKAEVTARHSCFLYISKELGIRISFYAIGTCIPCRPIRAQLIRVHLAQVLWVLRKIQFQKFAVVGLRDRLAHHILQL